ncbi:MAG: hypothetical protein ACFFG0_15515 [Candidatus Thorarchaeota archaeon]
MQRVEIEIDHNKVTLLEENINLQLSTNDDWSWIFVFKNKKHYLVLTICKSEKREETLEVFDFEGKLLGLIKYVNKPNPFSSATDAVKYYYKRLKI